MRIAAIKNIDLALQARADMVPKTMHTLEGRSDGDDETASFHQKIRDDQKFPRPFYGSGRSDQLPEDRDIGISILKTDAGPQNE